MPVRDSSTREEHFSEDSRAFLAWLRDLLAAKGWNRPQLALYSRPPIPTTTISAWFTRGTMPRLEARIALARIAGIKPSEIPGGSPQNDQDDAAEPSEVPGYVADLFNELDPYERRMTVSLMRELLVLREDREPYGESRELDELPPATPPPDATPPSRRLPKR